jgi:hypothetical protein
MPYASSKANRIPFIFTSVKQMLVTIICAIALLILLLLQVGCLATTAMENNTRKQMILSGYEPIAGEPSWVRDPETGAAHNVDAATDDRAPVKYWFAKVFDYGVLPAAGLAGLYWTADQIDQAGSSGSDNRKYYNFENDGPASVQDSSPSSSSDQSSRPSSTVNTTQVAP